MIAVEPAHRAGLTRGPVDLSPWSQSLREVVRREAQVFDEQAILFAESLRQTAGEASRQMRWALATAHVLDHAPIAIRNGERLVGWHPNTPRDEATRARVAEAREYLRTERVMEWGSEGHMALDYPTILGVGLDGILRQIDERAADRSVSAAQREFYAAARVSLLAVQRFIGRYADLAASLSEQAADRRWADELAAIAAVCRHIAHQPARTFRDALQLAWFCFLAVTMEAGNSHHCFGLGRIDQYLMPYLDADRRAGVIDDATVDDLLDQSFIKYNEFAPTHAGAVIVGIGGHRPDGSDATNDLSYRALRSSCRTRMYFPGIDIQWHRDMPHDFVRDACRLLANGNGQPSFFNDQAIIDGLLRQGVPYAHAVDHLPSTCTETSIQGRSNPWVAFPYVNIPMALLRALRGGRACSDDSADAPRTPVPSDYAGLLAAFETQLAWSAEDAVRTGVERQKVCATTRPFPLLSCFIRGCLESGRNISHGGALHNFLQPEAVGISNVVDALAAIRTLTVDEPRHTLDDFRAALDADWQGHEELLRLIQRD